MCIRDSFYAGQALEVIELQHTGDLLCTRLGNDIGQGCAPQHVVPANTWFAARVAPGGEFALVGCSVAPVSYTHLDVYKRQRLHRWQRAWGASSSWWAIAVRRCRPCGAQPCQRHGLLQAVQTCAGRFGAAAFALPSCAASGPIGRVQLSIPTPHAGQAFSKEHGLGR